MEDEAERNQSHYQVPTSRDLCIMQLGLSFGYICYVLTAWVYVSFMHEKLFPQCIHVWSHQELARGFLVNSCVISTYMYWTFPLVCAIVTLLLFYRDLMHTRIWYEMLGHKVLLNFTNVGFLQHTKVRLMLFWGLFGSTMYFFAAVGTQEAIEFTIPYWIPVFSFLGLLYTSWDLEDRLLSLPKFVENDPEWAKQYHMECYFIQDHVASTAFHKVHKRLNDQLLRKQLEEKEKSVAAAAAASKETPALPAPGSSGSGSGATAADQGATARSSTGGATSGRNISARSRSTSDPAPDQPLAGIEAASPAKTSPLIFRAHSHTTGGLITLIMEETMAMAKRGDEVPIHEHGFFDIASNKYWVRAFLYSEHLDDVRARNFIKWFRIYTIFTAVMILLLLYLFLITTVSHFIHQELFYDHWITRSISTKWMDDFKSYHPKASKLEKSFLQPHFLHFDATD